MLSTKAVDDHADAHRPDPMQNIETALIIEHDRALVDFEFQS